MFLSLTIKNIKSGSYERCMKKYHKMKFKENILCFFIDIHNKINFNNTRLIIFVWVILRNETTFHVKA